MEVIMFFLPPSSSVVAGRAGVRCALYCAVVNAHCNENHEALYSFFFLTPAGRWWCEPTHCIRVQQLPGYLDNDFWAHLLADSSHSIHAAVAGELRAHDAKSDVESS